MITITIQPQSSNIVQYDNLTLTIAYITESLDAPSTLQWWHGDAQINGATDTSLQVVGAFTSNGSYFATITSGSADGTGSLGLTSSISIIQTVPVGAVVPPMMGWSPYLNDGFGGTGAGYV